METLLNQKGKDSLPLRYYASRREEPFHRSSKAVGPPVYRDEPLVALY